MSVKNNNKSVIRLLYTSSVDISIGNGPGVNEREFIEALARRNDIEAIFVIPKPNNFQNYSNMKGARFYFAGKGHFRFILSQITQSWAVFQELRKENVDGIIIRSNLVPLVLPWVLGRAKTHVFLKTQGNPDIAWLCSQLGLKGWVSRRIRPLNIWLHKKLFRVASVIDCCTPQLVRSIQALLPENEQQKVVHIENATNPMRFNTMDKAACRSRLGLDRFSPVIGYVGGTPAERGGEQIMQTVAKLQAEHPDIAGCVVGGSEQEAQKLRNLAEELQVADRCIIPGQVDYDEVVYWINAFDVGVALDRADRLVNIGSSNQKIRQYLACGLPVVVGKGTSLFIEEHNLGYLVDPDDNDEFISAVSKLINLSTEKKHGIAHIGRQLCQREFSIDAALQKRLKYWESPLNE